MKLKTWQKLLILYVGIPVFEGLAAHLKARAAKTKEYWDDAAAQAVEGAILVAKKLLEIRVALSS